MHDPFEIARNAIKPQSPLRPVAHITQVNGDQITVHGWDEEPTIGSAALVRSTKQKARATVTHLTGGEVGLTLESTTLGVKRGDIVTLEPAREFRPGDHWIGRVINPDGVPLDGRRLADGMGSRAIFSKPPPAFERRPLGARFDTGYLVFDTFLPIVRGQRVGLFAGSGVGKSTLLGGLAKSVPADIIVIALVGERGREVNEFITNVLGPTGMQRSIVVAATSDQPARLREACAPAATAIAEHFRDQGKHVLLLIDSVTRMAEAHREVAASQRNTRLLRGFPTSTHSTIAGLCERAGTSSGTGTITAIYSVLVAGSDMEEPIADMLRGVLDGHVVLDREIAERARFPAVDVLRSVSRSLPHAATKAEIDTLDRARAVLATYARSELMISSGLYVGGSNPEIDRAISLYPKLEACLSHTGIESASESFEKIEATLRLA